MKIHRITSRDNPLLKTMRLAAARSRKSPPDLVLAEGIRVLEEVLGSGKDIEYVFISDGFGSNEREAGMLEAFSERHIRVVQGPPSLLNSVSDVSTPQGAIALVKVPERSISDLDLEENPLLICADALQDPGNLGTLGRTARAAGAAEFITTAGSASLKNPKTIRASAGALFHLPWIENINGQAFSQFCRERGISVYRSSASGGLRYWEVDFRSGCTIVLGNESRGASESDWPGAIGVHIPMTARAESLNVAAAGSVILIEAFRQRLIATNGPNQ